MRGEYREIRPGPRLARYVECYWTREEQPGDRGSYVLPDGCVDILFSAVRGEPVGLNVVGLMTTPLQSPPLSGRLYFGVRFRPGMASAFLPDAARLTDAVEPLESLQGAAARRLLEQLVEAAKPSEMVRLMESTLRPLEAPDPAQRALEMLPSPDVPLDRLASEVGLSERHLRRVCIERTGVSPKYLRRILRFREAAEGLRGAQPSWAQFAAACGYYDQAHFIREFQEFAGCTPGRFLQSRGGPSAAESKHDEPANTREQDRLHRTARQPD